MVGNEICYSESFSGTVCGNLVSNTNVVYNFGGDLTNLTGYQTEQFEGTSSAGNGDSGGPAIMPVLTSNGTSYELWAAGVISGIANAGPNCQGVPAGGGRQCSPTVVAADIADAADELDVQIMVYAP